MNSTGRGLSLATITNKKGTNRERELKTKPDPSSALYYVIPFRSLLLDEFSVSLTCDYRLNITEIDYISYYDKGEIECSELSYLFAS
ncbi:hypothetical protein QYF36_022765 [Acer negundo]|nr:hypothetical protein QYF36_022765 [Acer negundo]